MRTFEDLRNLLAAQISKEKKRLKTYGTKANSFDLANAITRYVQAFICDGRHREMLRLKKVLDKQPSQGNVHKIYEHNKDRLHGLEVMGKALGNFALTCEKNRPWRSKTEQKIDKEEKERKEEKEKKRKHDKHRESRHKHKKHHHSH